jgi:hypothetical protein
MIEEKHISVSLRQKKNPSRMAWIAKGSMNFSLGYLDNLLVMMRIGASV